MMDKSTLPPPASNAAARFPIAFQDAAVYESPLGTAWAPGRVNLIGDHTDYNDGFVLPLAVDLECRVDAEERGDGVVRLTSSAFPEPVELPAGGTPDPASVEPRWGRLPAGVVAALARRGRPPVGIEAEVTSTVPVGGGLSS